MYRFYQNLSLSSFQATKNCLSPVLLKRSLARGVGRIEKKVIPELDSKESILDCSAEEVNYLGFDEQNDRSIIFGGSKQTEEYHNEHERQILEKYAGLLERKKIPATGKKITTYFGQMRLDSDNVVKYHGQYEADQVHTVDFADIITKIQNTKISVPFQEYSSTYVKPPQQDSDAEPWIKDVEPNDVETKRKRIVNNKAPGSLITEKINFKYQIKKPKIKKNVDQFDDLDWFEHRFNEMEKREVKNVSDAKPIERQEEVDDEDEVEPEEETRTRLEILNSRLGVFDKKGSHKRNSAKSFAEDSFRKEISALDYLKKINAGQIDAHFKEEYDLLNDLKKKKQQSRSVDSKGYKILTSQLPDFSQSTKDEIVQILHRSIVYQNDDYIALNKPYGLALQGSSESSSNNLSRYLPDLAGMCGVEKLYTVHRLDRDTTGVLLLAKTQDSAKRLHDLFVERKIVKHYLAITKTVPDIKEGIIDIPIEIGFIKSLNGHKRERSVLCPEIVKDIRDKRRPSGVAKRAVTHYKVLQENGNAALLNIHPETGVKHQIRVHLGFGLRCPILGDHKYSSMDELVPQKLPTDILVKLHIRQQKARNVPMHLHAYEMFIPNYLKSDATGHVFVRAKVPFHFRKNAASLGLRMS